MSNFDCPIFEGGRIVGNFGGDVTDVQDVGNVTTPAPVALASLPDSAFLAPAMPTMTFVDRTAEAGQKRRDGHALMMRLFPKRTRAIDLWERRQEQVNYWKSVVEQAQAECTRLGALVARAQLSEMYEDLELGSRRERLERAADALREAREELCAAVEECDAAQKVVDSLTVTL
jgi:hypothetical protein